ncbi:hypothetical protein [Ensifer sp. B1-9]|uniref:hypothetical protein n=1 Tax=Ensifer sp. B1-9 TaxID=3141455 RepID=UPI003D214699
MASITEILMSRKPFDPTPEQIVADAVANSRPSGYEVPEDVQEVMLRIARGEMSADQAAAWEQEQASRIPPNEGMPSEEVFEQLMEWDRAQTMRIARIRAEHGLPPEEDITAAIEREKIGRKPE